MTRRKKAKPVMAEKPQPVALGFLQRMVARLQDRIANQEQRFEERTADLRERAETAEEHEIELRETIARLVPQIEAALGAESLDDSLRKYEAFRALDDLRYVARKR